MSLWGSVLLVSVVWLAVGLVIAISVGKLLKTNRELMEEDAISRVSLAITEFLNQEPDDDIVMYRDPESGKVKSEEAMEGPHPCIICLAYGYADDEDPRPELINIRDRYIPLCARHKEFVAQCRKDGILLDNGSNVPSG